MSSQSALRFKILTVPRNRSEKARDTARAARKNPSVAEAVMWKFLRNRQLEFKFRREHPIANYRLDFFCAEAMLAIEMNGEQHDPERDSRRDAELAKLGIEVFRVRNTEFFGIDEEPNHLIVSQIIRRCRERICRT